MLPLLPHAGNFREFCSTFSGQTLACFDYRGRHFEVTTFIERKYLRVINHLSLVYRLPRLLTRLDALLVTPTLRHPSNLLIRVAFLMYLLYYLLCTYCNTYIFLNGLCILYGILTFAILYVSFTSKNR